VLLALGVWLSIMSVFTVSLFGHREIHDILQLENLLFPIIKELLRANLFVVFLIGRNGDFDELAASVIKQTQKELKKENSSITLVLPYPLAEMEYYADYYDDIIIPDIVHRVHPKSAITLRNHWMVEQSDTVIVYSKHNKGGAFEALNYAKKINKKVINIYLCNNSLE
jgi:hypothetical protein